MKVISSVRRPGLSTAMKPAAFDYVIADSIDMAVAWRQSRYDKPGPGGSGADYLEGNSGDDVYLVDNGGDFRVRLESERASGERAGDNKGGRGASE